MNQAVDFLRDRFVERVILLSLLAALVFVCIQIVSPFIGPMLSLDALRNLQGLRISCRETVQQWACGQQRVRVRMERNEGLQRFTGQRERVCLTFKPGGPRVHIGECT